MVSEAPVAIRPKCFMAANAIDGRALNEPRLRAGLRDLLAGVICSILSVAYCLSYAALIFSGPLKHWLSYGIAVTFLSAAIAAHCAVRLRLQSLGPIRAHFRRDGDACCSRNRSG